MKLKRFVPYIHVIVALDQNHVFDVGVAISVLRIYK
jgi:hypothetical protein